MRMIQGAPGGGMVGASPSKGAGGQAFNQQSWQELEMKLAYMESEMTEAQAALAKKHTTMQEAIDRADGLETELAAEREELEATKKQVEDVKQAMAAQAQAHREREAAMQADIDGKAVQIEEATICLAARKETEGRLHAEAAAMLSALDASVAEGERLHAELRRCATEEQQRRDAAKSFCAESCAALESLQSAAATYAAEAQEQQTKLTALASEAVEQGKSEASKMQAGMATLLESVQSGVESVNGTMGERCAAGAAELQAAAQAQAAAVSALVEKVSKATEGVGSSLEAAVAKI